MSNIAKKRVMIRAARRKRIRGKVHGTGVCPRLCVKRSLSHMYAQIVDDTTGTSLVQLSSQSKLVMDASSGKSKMEISKILGKMIGEVAQEKGISKVVFDRGGYLFHGRVKALAEAARESGLKF